MRQLKNMKTRWTIATSLLVGILALPGIGRTQDIFKIQKGKAFDAAMPRDFYLEGNAIPTEKHNAALVVTPSGARMVVGLIDTSGYSSQVQEKYSGMIITEGKAKVCGNRLAIGSYGFGIVRPPGSSSGHPLQGLGASFILYNQAGQKVAGCPAKWDAGFQHPRPLEVVPEAKGSARLYLGRAWVELR